MKPVITIQNLSKRYVLGNKMLYFSFRDSLVGLVKNLISKNKSASKEIWALKNVNLKVNKGEVLGVIGKNGSGKSTFLKILSQITFPTKGRVLLEGRVGSLLEVGTGFHQELTGRENIYLNGAILGMKRSEINKKFDEIVEFSEIGEFLDTPVKHYSTGMYMRLAFSVAAFLEPEIMLIDEVLAVGDADFQEKCISKIDSMSKNDNRTVIFVSHNMEAIQKLCDRVVLIDHGRIIKQGSPSLITNYYLRETEKVSRKSFHERTDREGTGRVKIEEVIFKNEKGKKISSFKSGQNVNIKILFNRVSPNIKRLNFEIEIKSFYDQNKIAYLGNQIFRKTINADDKQIEIKINKLPIVPGRYQFSLCLYGINYEIYDYFPVAGTFNVDYGNYYNTENIPEKDRGYLLLDYSVS